MSRSLQLETLTDRMSEEEYKEFKANLDVEANRKLVGWQLVHNYVTDKVLDNLESIIIENKLNKIVITLTKTESDIILTSLKIEVE